MIKLLTFIYLFDEQFAVLLNNKSIGALAYALLSLVYIFKTNRKIIHELIHAKLIFIIIFYSFIINIINNDLSYRSFSSLALLLAIYWCLLLNPLGSIVNLKNSKYIIIIIIIFCLMDFMGINITYSTAYAGLFLEPSHLALYILPFICFRLLNDSTDFLSIISSVLIFALMQNSTFLIGFLFILMLMFVKNFKKILINKIVILKIITGALILSFISIYLFNFDKVIDRVIGIIYGGDDPEYFNMSSVVWINGWSQALEYLDKTSYFGVGINTMGNDKYENFGYYSDRIYETIGVVLNSKDGSFMASKIISELGLLGLLLILFMSVKSFVAFYSLLNTSNKKIDEATAIYLRATGGFIVLMLMYVRGGGYFQMVFLLAISLLFFSNITKKE
jgi:hypothetical protein